MSDSELKKFLVEESAADDYALYEKTGNGVLIWKIYRLYRKAGLPVPDYILDKLDTYADGVMGGGDALVALELKKAGAKGGSQGATANSKQEHERDIVLMCHVLRGRHTATQAYKMTADRFGTTLQNVKNAYSAWTNAAKAETKTKDAVINAQALINRFCR